MSFHKQSIELRLDDVTHTDLLNLVEHFQSIHGTCFLYSARNETNDRSFIFAYPFDEIHVENCVVSRTYKNTIWQHATKNPWSFLKEFASQGVEEKDLLSGFFSYEMAFYGDLFDLYTSKNIDGPSDAYMQKCSLEIIYEHDTKKLFATKKNTLPGGLFESIDTEWIRKRCTQTDLKVEKSTPCLLCSTEDEQSFCKKVEAVQELIRDGVVYQVNISHEMSLQKNFLPFQIFRKLCKKNPSSFFSFFHVNGTYIVSSSPERFICKKGDLLETRPIKGTRSKTDCPVKNSQIKKELRSSVKEVSELMMICDLMRNDLSMISVPGTTRVRELIRQEEYSHIYHQLSIIQSKPKPLHPIDMIQKIFPGGSVTGCPKRESLKTIHALENRRRGIYTGSIGYIDKNGDFDFNIAIRTIVITKNALSFGVGSGIVIDSDPYQEYLETLHKAQAIKESLE